MYQKRKERSLSLLLKKFKYKWCMLYLVSRAYTIFIEVK